MLIAAVMPVFSQGTPPVTSANLIRNGNFQQTLPRECLWNGVDSKGFLSGERGTAKILLPNGTIGDFPMPVSVAAADMNGDGLEDIVMMDVQGYMHIYFNSGTPADPKFTTGDLSTIFLTRVFPEQIDALLGIRQSDAGFDNYWRLQVARFARTAPHISLADLTRSEKKDLIIGNYCGEILYVPNAGTLAKPDFEQPSDISTLEIPTRKHSAERWGNLFAPFVFDWNGDGKPDLLIGEGSYSANNIHLLLNRGDPGRPVFNEDNHAIVAYGDGKVQLTPCAVDYYGDGKPALLVAESTGKIALYVNKAAGPCKSGDELTFLKYITVGDSAAPISFTGICTVAAADFHGSGLFDLIVGESSGRIAMVRNVGTKTEPKFSPPIEIRSNTASNSVLMPASWNVDYGLSRGNFYARAEVVTRNVDPLVHTPESDTCMRFGYRPIANKILHQVGYYTQGSPLCDPRNAIEPAKTDPIRLPAQYFLISEANVPLANETDYTLSFQVRGGTPTNAVAHVWCRAWQEGKITRGDRDSASIQTVSENFDARVDFSSSQNWTEVRKDFRVHFKNPELKNAKIMASVVVLGFGLPPGEEDVYISNVRLQRAEKSNG